MLRKTAHYVLRTLAILWASPWSLVGTLIGVCGLAAGGRVRRRGRVIEFYGSAVRWFFRRLPRGEFAAAMTLGHVILGVTDTALDICRDHEMVHVRQYERWGPLFIPSYLLCSLILWIAGKDAYRDNPFERAAYDETG